MTDLYECDFFVAKEKTLILGQWKDKKLKTFENIQCFGTCENDLKEIQDDEEPRNQ
jgi:hypothetical protein